MENVQRKCHFRIYGWWREPNGEMVLRVRGIPAEIVNTLDAMERDPAGRWQDGSPCGTFTLSYGMKVVPREEGDFT